MGWGAEARGEKGFLVGESRVKVVKLHWVRWR